MSAVAVLPIAAAVDAAWDRYATLMREIVDDSSRALDRQHMERTTVAEAEWKAAYLALTERA